MPELPDVEEQAKSLRSWLVGHRIVQVRPPDGKRQRGRLSAPEFVRRIQGKKIVSVGRRGKWILLRLSDDGGIGIHLGMTGEFECDHRSQGPRFAHAHFALENRDWVHYIDPRRFGKMIAATRYPDLLAHPAVAEVGPDALSELKLEQLQAATHSSRAIKEVLMDQRVIAGLGNVYATEALWLAKIHPALRADCLSSDRPALRKLLNAIRSTLRRGLKAYDRGTVLSPHVYGRRGLPCPRCGTTLKSQVIGARTSVFCPRCQKF